jgi:hypothetical protein
MRLVLTTRLRKPVGNPARLLDGASPCRHRDAYGSTVILGRDLRDSVCILCDEVIPALYLLPDAGPKR